MTTRRFLRAAVIGAAAFSGSMLTGCQSSTVDKFPAPVQIIVHVNDEHPTPVPGVTVDLLIPASALVWRSGVTDASGNAYPGAPDGGILPGDYTVRITPPAGFHLAPAFSNSVPITVQSNKPFALSIQILSGP